MGKCKECVTWLLVAMSAAEALEHNAGVGGYLRDVGKTIKEMVTPKEWKDLVSELDWFERPIAELTADVGVVGSLSELEKKCDLDVSRARELHREANEYNEKGISSAAWSKYIQLKRELVSLAEKMSCLKDGQD